MSGSGIYLFSENAMHLYVGRTDNLRQRLQRHQRESSKHNAAVTFRLAREQTGQTQATYRPEGSRTHIDEIQCLLRHFVYRVLKPGGTLLVIAETYRNQTFSWLFIVPMFLLRARYLTLDEHRAVFRAAGFADIEIDHDPRKGWICGVARRPAA
ncbi:MAG: GIY-YIG nuclease family protein [Acidobacteriota bacterium]